jgi:ADP-ribose pyrophosphatase
VTDSAASPPELSRSTTPPEGFEVLASREEFSGKLVSVRSDHLRTGPDHDTTYDVVTHAPAAAVVALDDAGRVLMVRQWRHAIGAAEWELPAGIADPGEDDLQVTAARELAEETGATADSWSHLVTLHTSPGFSTERCEVYLATGARLAEEPHREAAEAGMRMRWVDVADAVAAVRSGQVTNVLAVVGLLAVAGPLREV